jgi:electron transport complex protein RnfG
LNQQASTITGLFVLDQKETPGLGNFITSDELFLNQFAGLSADEPLLVTKADPSPGSTHIRALTGATISSESVAAIVNGAVANLREPIRQLSSTSVPTMPGSPRRPDDAEMGEELD